MNKIRLFASTRNNGSAQSGLARVSAAFVVLIGVVLLVMSGCAGDVTVPVPVPTEPKPKEPVKLPKLNIQLEISAGTVMQGGDVTLSATVTNTGDAPSLKSALLVFYRSDDAIITPDIISNGLEYNIEPSATLAIKDAMHSGFGLDPVLYANFIKRSLAADQNVQEAEAIDERAKQNAREGIAGLVLDPVINSKIVAPLAINQTSNTQTITIPSTADVGNAYYGACVILLGINCASKELAVTAAPVPDLVPASPAAPIFNKSTYAANETVTVSMKVRNAGGADSTDGVVRLVREAGDTDVQIGEPITLGTIAVGAAVDLSTTFVTEDIMGVYQQEYYFIIDTVSNEANSGNNNSGPGLIVVSQKNLIDVDEDRLIDIRNLDMLNNIRYNLAGTSYKTFAVDSGKKCGASADIDCIGYELMRDLDFTHYSSYENNNVKSEWLPNNDDPTQATNTGWDPLGSAEFFRGSNDLGTVGKIKIVTITNLRGPVPVSTRRIIGDPAIVPIKAFSAIFEGNGHRISNLYSLSENDGGLFRVVIGTVRNLTIFNATVSGGGGSNKVGIIAGTVFGEGLIINCAARGGSVRGGGGSDAIGGLVGAMIHGRVAASYSTASVYIGGGGYSYTDKVGGLVGINMSGTIIASYAAGYVHSEIGTLTKYMGGLIGLVDYSRYTESRAAVIATYTTANVREGGSIQTYGNRGWLGGFIARIVGHPSIVASYTTSDTNRSFVGTPFVSTATQQSRFSSYVSSYSFGTSDPASGFNPYTTSFQLPFYWGNAKPNGVIRASDLAANNVDATWNSANSQTAGAWAFDASYGGPALKYADYDGDGGVDYCAHLPAGACSENRLLPNQPVFDQGSSRQSAYIIDTQIRHGVNVSVPAKLTRGDTDYFQITVKQAGWLIIQSDSSINTQATLYTSNGDALEYNDNGGVGNNFKMARGIARGVYYIRVYGYSNQVGSYAFDVRMAE